MSGRLPEERVRAPVMLQSWCDFTFLHWSYEPDVLAPLLPQGLEPDVFEGRAWVSITPFHLRDLRLGPLPALPGLSDFPETNTRTYVRGPDGADGLWFFSLDAANPAAVAAARSTYGAPYMWSDMSVSADPPSYHLRRRWPGPATVRCDLTVDVGEPIPDDEITPLDDFLTGRWRFYSILLGRLVRSRAQHSPWPLHNAGLRHLDESLLAAAGLPAPDAPAIVQWSPGVENVRISAPARV